MQDRSDGIKTIIGGDFNARTGSEGEWNHMEYNGDTIRSEDERRRSKDKTVNREGRLLVSFINVRGWAIMNGSIERDEEGEWTFMGGKGNTVIDYAIGNVETWEGVEKIEIGEKIDSDHHPVIVWVKGNGRRIKSKKSQKLQRYMR